MPAISPLRSVWFHPGKTIAYIAHENPGYRLLVLPIVAGFLTLPTVALFGADEEFAFGYLFGLVIGGGPLFELLKVFVGAYLIRLTGIWLGGKAATTSLQTAIAWGNVPIVAIALLGFVLSMVAFVYNENAEEALQWGQSTVLLVVGIGLVIVQLVAVFWSLLILVRGVAVVQGFSSGRAIINTLSAWLLSVVIVLLLLMAVGLTEHLSDALIGGVREFVLIHANT